jgi:hypothetical protein
VHGCDEEYKYDMSSNNSNNNNNSKERSYLVSASGHGEIYRLLVYLPPGDVYRWVSIDTRRNLVPDIYVGLPV